MSELRHIKTKKFYASLAINLAEARVPRQQAFGNKMGELGRACRRLFKCTLQAKEGREDGQRKRGEREAKRVSNRRGSLCCDRKGAHSKTKQTMTDIHKAVRQVCRKQGLFGPGRLDLCSRTEACNDRRAGSWSQMRLPLACGALCLSQQIPKLCI